MINISSALKRSQWPWPKFDIGAVASAALNRVLYLPHIGYLDVVDYKSWNAEIVGAVNSKLLWLNSLVSVQACLKVFIDSKNDDYLNVAHEIMFGYFSQYLSDNSIFKFAWKDEHAVLNRLFVLTAMLHEIVNSSISRDKFGYYLSLAYLHANWLCDDKNYVKNNHGVMMDLSLCQFGIFISEFDSFYSAVYIEKSLSRLDFMFDHTFDVNGYCTENSSSYHFVNLTLFRHIRNFICEHDLNFNVERWTLLLAKAELVGALLIRSDGSIPLIGDSESKIGSYVAKNNAPLSPYGFYPDAGLFVFNDNNLFFTFRAGGVTFSHRHIDDLSVTLFYKGVDFIVDAGLYNYDINDPLRRWFISSKAHSSINLQSEAQVLFRNFESPAAMSRFLNCKVDSCNFDIAASHDLSKEATVNRAVSYNDRKIFVTDTFNNDTLQMWRIQYVLHPGVNVKILSDNELILESGGNSIGMKFTSGFLFKIENSKYSDKFMQVVDTKVIVIQGGATSLNFESVISLI